MSNQRCLFFPLSLFLGIACLVPFLRADVSLPAIFGDHMVLQQGVTLPVWGWASPGERVMVGFGDRFEETIADSHGSWRVTFRPLMKSSEPAMLVINARNRIELRDVIVGDVWICAGEGNMPFPLSDAVTGKGGNEGLKDPDLRFFVATNRASMRPDHKGEGHWVVCTPESAPSFSAVGYFFARDIRSAQHLPIGMIQCAWAETPAQAWISLQGLSSPPSFATHLVTLARAMRSMKSPEAPSPQDESHGETQEQLKSIPSTLFNGMISPLIPYALTGVIWYQGESNLGSDSLEYRRLFLRLIRDWRSHWGQGLFPFFFVSLPGFGENDDSPVEQFPQPGPSHGGALPWLRESMAASLSLSGTGMAVATDLGVPGEALPPDKLDVGRRLALLARHRVYGEELTDSGPVYAGMTIEKDKIRVRFGSVGSGLTIGASPWQPDDAVSLPVTTLRGFAISGSDGTWYPADARIEGDNVLLSHDALLHPVAVRYDWKGVPVGNLYNKEGLPAAPFRTDCIEP